jgi:hypothetical protein
VGVVEGSRQGILAVKKKGCATKYPKFRYLV